MIQFILDLEEYALVSEIYVLLPVYIYIYIYIVVSRRRLSAYDGTVWALCNTKSGNLSRDCFSPDPTPDWGLSL